MKHLLSTTFVLLFGFSSASAFEMTVEQGFSSNPYKISDNNHNSDSNDTAAFTLLKASTKNAWKFENRDEIQLSSSLGVKKYGNGFGDADTVDFRSRFRWVNRMKIRGKSSSVLVTADAGLKRLTYVSQLTGEPALTSRGESISDRFSYNFFKLSAELIYRLDKSKSIGLYTYASRRHYVTDYTEIGLESLDFTELGLQPTIRFKSESGTYIRGFLYLKKRDYLDLLNDDLQGRNVEGSLLNYSLSGYGLLLKKPLTEKLSFSTYISGYRATDNGEGYRDFTYHRISTSLTYNVTDRSAFVASLDCFTRGYLKNAYVRNETETDEMGRKKKGCKTRLKYEAPFRLFKTENMIWNTEIVHSTERNTDELRSYDGWTLTLGITISL